MASTSIKNKYKLKQREAEFFMREKKWLKDKGEIWREPKKIRWTE